jgi:quercetin dioxygenase-like cupin family protein
MRLWKRKDRTIYKDARGIIDVLLSEKEVIKNVLYITGKKGSIRGDHYHKKDTHYCLILQGAIDYRWFESNPGFLTVSLGEGDLVYTPTGEVHRFTFLTDGIFLAMATQSRQQKNYESDTIKVQQ